MSMQAVEAEAQSLRCELGLLPELPQAEEAPRFSKRARQMEPETELAAAAAVHLSEAHAAHLRLALTGVTLLLTGVILLLSCTRNVIINKLGNYCTLLKKQQTDKVTLYSKQCSTLYNEPVSFVCGSDP